jgi:hypothetical protein
MRLGARGGRGANTPTHRHNKDALDVTVYLTVYRPHPRGSRGVPVDRIVRGVVEPTLGFEPRTCCLRNSCSTTELCLREGESRRCAA